MANFGIGLGAFLNGVANGAQVMSNIQDNWSKKEVRDMQVADLKQARDDKQQLRGIYTQGAKDAAANTDGQLDNMVNYFSQNVVPKAVQHYLSTGDIDKANALQKWGSDANVLQGAKYGAGMMRAAAMKDLDGVGQYMLKAYNQPGYFEDGNTATGYNVLKNDKGEPTGLEITLKGADGKESKHTFNSVDEVYKVAQTFGNPLTVFNTGMQAWQQQQQQAAKTQAELAKEGREWKRTLAGKELDQQYKLEGQNNEAQLKAAAEAEKRRTGGDSKKVQDAEAVAGFLKSQGYSDEYIRQNAPALVGIQNQSRSMSARIQDVIKLQTENSREFRKLTPDQQVQEARKFIDMIDRNAQGATPTDGGGMGLTPQSGQTQQNAQQPAQTQGQGLTPFYDTRTNSIIYR